MAGKHCAGWYLRPPRQSTARRSRLRRGLPDRRGGRAAAAVDGAGPRTSRAIPPRAKPVADTPSALCSDLRHTYPTGGAPAQCSPVPPRARHDTRHCAAAGNEGQRRRRRQPQRDAQRTGSQGDAPRSGDRGGRPLRADGQRGHPGRPALSAQHCQRHRRTANPRDGGNGAFAAAQPGDQVTLTVARGIEHLTVKVRLGELPGS